MTEGIYTQPCGCGSCEDAFKAALRLYNQSVKAGDCVTWRLRVFALLEMMAELESGYRHFKDNGYDPHFAVMSTTEFANYANNNAKEAAKILLLHAVGREADGNIVEAITNFSGSKSVYRQQMLDVFAGEYVCDEVKDN